MGIKGIYSQLGPGERVSLSKLTADIFRESNRPLRLAIDFAIWQYQNQAARGGPNPALRNLFYRLARLKCLPVQPIFVFDGPHKPALKRKKRSGRGDAMSVAQAKRMIRMFGFVSHDAPGEGEAECALLQKHGIVDAVLSEDVDTIMFGCTKTLRNWSGEGKATTTPTHVSLYDVEGMSMASQGLDREGMVLVALMSGGDYLPGGISGCGITVACKAAEAGFGRTLCQLKTSDKTGIERWKESLVHELATNENNIFRTRNKALASRISSQSDFPNLEVLRFYTHPVVSPVSTLDAVRQKFHTSAGELHLEALREYTREEFGWDFRKGAIKFIRLIGPGLLVHKMLHEPDQVEDQILVKRVAGRRTHFSTDAEPELRLAYVPAEIVPLDISNEIDENIAFSREGLALNADDDFDISEDEAIGTNDSQSARTNFDIEKPQLAWVIECLAKRAIPTSVLSAWELAEQKKANRKSPEKKTVSAASKAKGTQSTLDSFVNKVTKASAGASFKTSSQPSKTDDSEQKSTLTKKNKSKEGGSKHEKIKTHEVKEHEPARQFFRPPPPLPEPSKPPMSSTKTRSDNNTMASLQGFPSRNFTSIQRPEAPLISSITISENPSLRSVFGPHTLSCPQISDALRPIHSAAQDSNAVKPIAKLSKREVTNSLTAPMTTTASKRVTRDSTASLKNLRQVSIEDFIKPATFPTIAQQFSPKASDVFQALGNLTPSLPKEDGLEWLESKEQPSQQVKKLLVRRSSTNGFFKEIEVDVNERDEIMSREAKSGRWAVRMSDVTFIDLTQDD